MRWKINTKTIETSILHTFITVIVRGPYSWFEYRKRETVKALLCFADRKRIHPKEIQVSSNSAPSQVALASLDTGDSPCGDYYALDD